MSEEVIDEAVYDGTPVERVANELRGCLPAALAGAVVLIAVVVWVIGGEGLFGDDNARPEAATRSCDAPVEAGDALEGDCPPPAQTQDNAGEESTTAPPAVPVQEEGDSFAPPAADDVPGDAQLFQGTSGPVGCITCDGQPRFIHVENGSIAAGQEALPGQQIVWPEDGTVVEFGARVTGPNRGLYGFNIHAHGGVETGCGISPGQTSCLMRQRTTPLRAGDRVAVVVTEGGTRNEEGGVADLGEFSVEWWFVFQPD